MAKSPDNTTAPSSPASAAAPEAPSLLRRLIWPLLNLVRRPARAALLGATVAIIGLTALSYLVFFRRGMEKATLENALAKLESHDYAEARRLAAEIRTGKEATFSDVGGAFFVLGAVMAEDAARHENPQEQKTLHLIASRYLEESRIRGFPPQHESEGLLLLGRALHRGGRHQASLPILKEALAHNPTHKGEILSLLAQSHLQLSPPNLEQASVQVRRLLAEKHLAVVEREKGLLLQAKIALAQGKYAEGRKPLEGIGPKSESRASAVLLSVRLLCEEVRAAASEPSTEDTADLQSALKALSEVSSSRKATAETEAQAELLSAFCLELLGLGSDAIQHYERVRKNRFGSSEATAAAFYQADFQLRTGHPDESVSLFKLGLTDAGAAESYQNDWLPKDVLKSRLQQAMASLLGGRHFAAADELARSLSPLFPEELASSWRARIEHEWGAHLLSQIPKDHAPGHQAAENVRQQARKHFRLAGAHFERLAELRVTSRTYLDDLMDSARDYLAGQAYEQSVRVLRMFLNEDPPRGQEEGQVALGEALLAAGRTREGLEVLTGAITQHPRHPTTYRARYLASQGYEEVGNIAEARRHLNDNLYNFSLSPESSDWRDSIFLLGRLMYQEGLAHEAKSRQIGVDLASDEFRQPGLKELEAAEQQFQAAARILEEAVERYPAAPQTIEARYFLADAHRQAARWPRKRLDSSGVEASRGMLTRQMQAELAAAFKEYTLLIEKLSAERDGASASELDRAILRNSYFARADVLFDQGKLDEALAAYSAATSRYQHEPEALEAYLQIATCHRRQGRMAEARGTLEQARVVLGRMKPDTNFTKTTPYSREQWSQLLTWLAAL